MSCPVTLPSELIDVILDQVALLDPTALYSCALASRTFVYPSQKHIFHTIDLKSRDEDFAHGYSWMTHPRTPISRTLGFLPNLRSFALSFNYARVNWSAVPEETQAALRRVFAMESVREVELAFVFGLPMALLMSLAKLKHLALSNVGMDTNDDSESASSDTLEGLYLNELSPATIKTLAKALSAPGTPPTLRKLALTPTFEEGSIEAFAELILACGSHLTSFAWLPSINSPFYINLINISPLHHLRSLHFLVSFRDLVSFTPFAPTLALLLQISNRPNAIERITIECHCIFEKGDEGQTPFATVWWPLDALLSASTSNNEDAIFGNLKEVEIILSENTIPPDVIDYFVKTKGELLPNVEARGVGLTKNEIIVTSEPYTTTTRPLHVAMALTEQILIVRCHRQSEPLPPFTGELARKEMINPTALIHKSGRDVRRSTGDDGMSPSYTAPSRDTLQALTERAFTRETTPYTPWLRVRYTALWRTRKCMLLLDHIQVVRSNANTPHWKAKDDE
ncbi:hypothetical protein M413DRAFT_6732 [Hebeloma cylindrosporum]|uniref:F-box domain-containing protein n=1 Tax=Hebeloma cylindrosporum TaxID=76867 RepID=A0A0C2Z9U3_HEBCY|nr:hypothetical protein M413DRAFT_6732 [Hebeloma cylindrosporum h7]